MQARCRSLFPTTIPSARSCLPCLLPSLHHLLLAPCSAIPEASTLLPVRTEPLRRPTLPSSRGVRPPDSPRPTPCQLLTSHATLPIIDAPLSTFLPVQASPDPEPSPKRTGSYPRPTRAYATALACSRPSTVHYTPLYPVLDDALPAA
ncbi:hypothetical protein FA13DRAFT_1475137 [Coprinellus micaceus]|uniref:Uncharacterized protein n=1 Tax=Coprinellus micaceus TaxID=71717 RepID=A0A4Y7SM19_COPMI|nr:hypothetical protein FA13DRAFT_1475137 [Coprinellus micaceus]